MKLEAHIHANEDDAFFIIEGQLTFTFGGRDVPAPPGTFVLVPPGVEHGFRNDGTDPVRMFNIHAPAGFTDGLGCQTTPDRGMTARIPLESAPSVPCGSVGIRVSALSCDVAIRHPRITLSHAAQ